MFLGVTRDELKGRGVLKANIFAELSPVRLLGGVERGGEWGGGGANHSKNYNKIIVCSLHRVDGAYKFIDLFIRSHHYLIKIARLRYLLLHKAMKLTPTLNPQALWDPRGYPRDRSRGPWDLSRPLEVWLALNVSGGPLYIGHQAWSM